MSAFQSDVIAGRRVSMSIVAHLVLLVGLNLLSAEVEDPVAELVGDNVPELLLDVVPQHFAYATQTNEGPESERA